MRTVMGELMCRLRRAGTSWTGMPDRQWSRRLQTAPFRDGGSQPWRTNYFAVLISAVTATIGYGIYVGHRKKVEAATVPRKPETLQLQENSRWNWRNLKPITIEEAKKRARDLCLRIKDESGSPGLSVAVTVDGELVYEDGMGYADVENRVPCAPHTVMRIASISKPLTVSAAARLLEEGKLDLDKPVQEYVKYFPVKYFEGKEVKITTRHLVSHLSGIRHYSKTRPDDKKEEEKESDSEEGWKKKRKGEFDLKEYYIKDPFPSVQKAVEMFCNDDLLYEPGKKYLYSTHAFTLLSAVVEEVSGEPFTKVMNNLFHELGLQYTSLDENSPIMYHRARYYKKDDKGRLINAPYVDNSYKWAGGGFQSTVGDLVKYGNALLYSHSSGGNLPRGLHLPSTMRMLWSPVPQTESWDRDAKYGMGWSVTPRQINYPFCNAKRFYVSHTGGAVGASSALLIIPDEGEDDSPVGTVVTKPPPLGTVVAILVNMQEVGLKGTAMEIALLFQRTRSS